MSGPVPPKQRAESPTSTDERAREPGVRVHLPTVVPGADLASSMAPDLARRIRAASGDLGFVATGFTTLSPFDAAGARVKEWLDRGYAGEMAYLAAADRHDPGALMADATTLISVALGYGEQPGRPDDTDDADALVGSVARYARGADYHDILKSKLRELADQIASLCARPVLARPCVDTAPLLEHEAAARSGVGFVAKNTLTIVPGYGSYVLLGELLVNVAVSPHGIPEAPRCGSCRACLDACPTDAFVDGNVLDARRCISYLTIELQGSIPRELRSAIGTRVFGCDVCQEVCPFNARSETRSAAPELVAVASRTDIPLPWLLELRSGDYRRLVKGSSMRRVTRQQLRRNAAVALGNTGQEAAVAPLIVALCSNPSPMVREHSAWALGELGYGSGAAALRAAQSDTDPSVGAEARAALARLTDV